jgi:hypothetical protein
LAALADRKKVAKKLSATFFHLGANQRKIFRGLFG